ncbi:MAG: glucan biosynthesis protein D, partial [Caulobacteraceae bacterium]|nr:glucan biosynthesis protein D [Caulobacteraceae bacterium]
MTRSIDRRALLGVLSTSTAMAAFGGRAGAQGPQAALTLGPAQAFDFEGLKTAAQRKAGQPYVPSPRPDPVILEKIDYDAWGQIKFDTNSALFKDAGLPVTFFHLGRFFQKAVEVYAVENGQARQVVYDQRYFDMPADSPAKALPKGVGFAGFRVQEPRGGALDWRKNDWVAFLGATYFRAIGQLHQYGLSARAVAIDTAVYGKDEEFPDFTQVYIEKPSAGARTITVHALLEGPSVVGACRFVMTRGKGVVMDIDQTLFLRKAVNRLGLAPLTSMYWYSETVKPTAIDWRPEVHDSDGLAIWNGAGEHLWRPLNDPAQITASAFGDDNPKGFGLLQRDRVFDHYLDGVFYDRRPSLWVEPKGDWGKGAVQLIELPTDDEDHDNVVAAWVPQAPAAAGARFDIGYRLYWLADEPHPTPLACCVATRLGRGGQPG